MHVKVVSMVYHDRVDLYKCFDLLSADVRAHSLRVARIAGQMFEWMLQRGVCLEAPDQFTPLEVGFAALYHDVGMCMVPESIIQKRHALTHMEQKVLNRHAAYGGRMVEGYMRRMQLSAHERRVWQLTADVALSHHERWDGSGFPFGLLATAISLPARITAVANEYDLLTCSASGAPCTHEQALRKLSAWSGKWFDPEMLEWLETHAEELERVRALPADALVRVPHLGEVQGDVVWWYMV